MIKKTEVLTVEHRDLGIESVDGKEMILLLKTTHSRSTVNREVSENVQTVKSWISKAGRLAKQEFLSKNSKMGTTRMTMVYEPDPSIKIEAPIK